VNEQQPEACLVTIATAECGNGLDLANILLKKCTLKNVCGN
jgi:hypothetical protein